MALLNEVKNKQEHLLNIWRITYLENNIFGECLFNVKDPTSNPQKHTQNFPSGTNIRAHNCEI